MFARLVETLRHADELAGKLESAGEAFVKARALRPERSPEAVQLVFKEATLLRELGGHDEAIDWYSRGLEMAVHLPPGPARDTLELELAHGIAVARFRQGEFADCVARTEEVVSKALAVGDEEQLAHAYMLLHLVHTQQGSPERAAFRALALPIFEKLGDLKAQAIALNNLGIEAYFDGKWALALEVYERSQKLFERIGDVDNVAMTVNNIGEILSDQGRLEEAEMLFRQVQETVDAAGHRGLSMMSRLNLGRAAARAGRFSDADELLQQAAEGFREIGASSFEQEVHARIAEAAVLAGDHERALREVELAESSGESDPPPALRAALDRVRGYAYLQLHERDAAESEFTKSVDTARGSSTLYELALSLRAQETLRGIIVEDGEAQRLLEALEVVFLPDVPTA